jgi:hypothetical protein
VAGIVYRTEQMSRTLCRDCRKIPVEGIRRYCGRCALKRKLAFTRESKRRKRGLNGRKRGNSPIGAEALTKAESSGRHDDPKTPMLGDGFSSTRQGVAEKTSDGEESISTARRAHIDS